MLYRSGGSWVSLVHSSHDNWSVRTCIPWDSFICFALLRGIAGHTHKLGHSYDISWNLVIHTWKEMPDPCGLKGWPRHNMLFQIPCETPASEKCSFLFQMDIVCNPVGHKPLTYRDRVIGFTRSISWLLMLWLLSLPGHQHPWYWPWWISKSLSYLRKNFNYLCHTNVEKWHKM